MHSCTCCPHDPTSSVACVGTMSAATSTTTTAATVLASTNVPAMCHTCTNRPQEPLLAQKHGLGNTSNQNVQVILTMKARPKSN